MERLKNIYSPALKPYTFAIRTSQRLTKNCKRVCLANTRTERQCSKNERKIDWKNKQRNANKVYMP